jgi:hypothetical protein
MAELEKKLKASNDKVQTLTSWRLPRLRQMPLPILSSVRVFVTLIPSYLKFLEVVGGK